MAKISFKGKIKTRYYVDNTIAYQYINIPKLSARHCDMQAFREHSKYGGFANSDLFLSILAKIQREKFIDMPILRLDRIPVGVKIDCNGFLAIVSMDV